MKTGVGRARFISCQLSVIRGNKTENGAKVTFCDLKRAVHFDAIDELTATFVTILKRSKESLS